MAADASIVARISGDASGLVAALEQTKQGVAKFGDDVVKTLDRKLGARDIFKGLLQGLGIASAQGIAEKLAAPFREAAEAAKTLQEHTERTANATERLIKLRQDDNQQLATLIKQQAKLQRDAEAAGSAGPKNKFGPFGLIDRGSALDKLFGLSSGSDNDRAVAASEAAVAVQEKAVEVETKKAEIKKRAEDAALKAAKEELQYADKLKDAKAKLAEFERTRRLEELDSEQKIVTLTKEKAAVEADIAKFKKFTADGGDLTVDGVNELLGLKEKQLALEKQIEAATKDKAKAEALIGATITSNIAEWEKFKMVVTSTGRGDSELTDRELERKITETQRDVNARQQVKNQTNDHDWLLTSQQFNLQSATAERDFRAKVRGYTAALGEDAAFGAFPGLSETRFQQINNTAEKIDRTNDLLLDIRTRLAGGIPTLAVNSIRGGP